MRHTILKTLLISSLLLVHVDFAAAASPQRLMLHMIKFCMHQKNCAFLKGKPGKTSKTSKTDAKDFLKFALKIAPIAMGKHKHH